MNAAPRRKPPTNSGLVLTPNVEPIRSAPLPAEDEPTPQPVEAEISPEPPTLQAVPTTVVDEPASAPKAAKAPRRRAARPTPDEGTKGPEDRIRPSNVHVPTTLVDLLEAKRQTSGLTTGELILVAIEETVSKGKLEELIHPGKTVGGTLFAARPSNRAAAHEAGHKAPVNYRLREGDYVVLDELVAQYKAPSRNHLIVAALKGYLG
ncbi:hypothetical protein Xcel_3416 (plasmid) [Xylanimonas cellulosilytica DSM 15894]|uniref:Uncharacterized protein n=1 Tax=Xylanimonas cellulosilytica (strain DSM 15894 / JCM 12276 / CECT 5975 / KCTC 9989 / LMG 20990 / NBRC 107835 / XIL07) TaxID=446471 RepID=D1C0U9_XYLCX|nr:hypothetical protein [Xylanimonas cellulosilytica]ACZ32415.1 hypothetical protein Xcel_3416 [Xylanimonas cellulosilytica DSM 15894]